MAKSIMLYLAAALAISSTASFAADASFDLKYGVLAGLTGDPEIIGAAWDLFAPGLTSDLSIVASGLQQILDEDIRAGLVDNKFTLDRVVNDRILKLAQQELRAEGRLKP